MTTDNNSIIVEIQKCLGNDWLDLATYLGLKPYQQRRFRHGYEFYDIWHWLEDSHRLGELPAAFRAIDRPDLTKLLEATFDPPNDHAPETPDDRREKHPKRPITFLALGLLAAALASYLIFQSCRADTSTTSDPDRWTAQIRSSGISPDKRPNVVPSNLLRKEGSSVVSNGPIAVWNGTPSPVRTTPPRNGDSCRSIIQLHAIESRTIPINGRISVCVEVAAQEYIYVDITDSNHPDHFDATIKIEPYYG